MKLEQSFTVTAPVEQVWAALIDVERVAPCLPGAQVTGQTPEGAYEGTFSVKLGPATASYRGTLKMDSLDEASRTATMHANGTDKRGQGGAHAVIVSSMRQEGDETHVDVSTDFSITGRLARFGRGGMIEDISKRLMREFAQCLQASLTTEPAAAGAPAESAPIPPASEREQAQAAVASTGEAAAEASAAGQPPSEPAGAEPGTPLPGEAAAGAAPSEPAAPPGQVGGEEAAPSEPVAAEPGAPLPGEAAAGAAPAEPVAPERAASIPAEAAAEAAPSEPAAPEPAAPEPTARAEAAAASAPLPGEEAAGEPARRAGEPDPWGPLSPPAQPTAAPEEESPRRTESIPPPSARAAPPPAKPVKGFSLLFGVLWDRIKGFFARLFRRGGS